MGMRKNKVSAKDFQFILGSIARSFVRYRNNAFHHQHFVVLTRIFQYYTGKHPKTRILDRNRPALRVLGMRDSIDPKYSVNHGNRFGLHARIRPGSTIGKSVTFGAIGQTCRTTPRPLVTAHRRIRRLAGSSPRRTLPQSGGQ